MSVVYFFLTDVCSSFFVLLLVCLFFFFFFQAEDGIRDWSVTGVQTCALPIFRQGDRDELTRNLPGIRAGGSTCSRWRPHHGFLQQCSRQVIPDLWGLHRFQGGSRGDGPCACQRTAWQKHHGQCGGAGPGANGPVPEGQERRTDRRIKEDESARSARHARRHGKSSVIPCRS